MTWVQAGRLSQGPEKMRPLGSAPVPEHDAGAMTPESCMTEVP